jgi:hypothetical protein
MGNIKDWYFCYADNGDQFVSRCLALLPILSADLTISPPYFKEHSDFKCVTEMISIQFHALCKLPEYDLFLCICQASLLHHKGWIADFLVLSNHVEKTTLVVFRDAQQ